MDVEFEEVEEGVVDEGDGAVDFALGAVAELEGLGGLGAGREGDPLELVVGGFDVFAGFPGLVSIGGEASRHEGRTSFGSCIRR